MPSESHSWRVDNAVVMNARARVRVSAVQIAAGALVCERCVIADTPWLRLRGLLGRRELAAGDGLLLSPSSSIHMFFMRFAIDAVFLDAEGGVLRVVENLKPWRLAAQRGSRAVLELAAGECERRGVSVGQRLEVAHDG
jgi:uncharacterized membrane protein (UPF0127 family)